MSPPRRQLEPARCVAAPRPRTWSDGPSRTSFLADARNGEQRRVLGVSGAGKSRSGRRSCEGTQHALSAGSGSRIVPPPYDRCALPRDDVTRLLVAWSDGEPGALDRLIPLVYGELRRQARRQLGASGPGTRSSPRPSSTRPSSGSSARAGRSGRTASSSLRWPPRPCGASSSTTRARAPRPSGARARRWSRSMTRPSRRRSRTWTCSRLDQALDRLAAIDARQARVVELRYFGGLSAEETAAPRGLARHGQPRLGDGPGVALPRARRRAMTPERWERLKEVFEHARQLEPRAAGLVSRRGCARRRGAPARGGVAPARRSRRPGPSSRRPPPAPRSRRSTTPCSAARSGPGVS